MANFNIRWNMTRFRVGRSQVVLGAFVASLLVLARTAAAQPLAERSDQAFIAPGSIYTLAEAGRICVTPLELRTNADIHDEFCTVEELQQIGARDGTRWYAAQYLRSALVGWAEPADSVEWDELVLLRSESETGSIVPVWHIRTERIYEFVSGVKAQSRHGVLLIEVLLCLNGTGGCSRNYLVDSAGGLGFVSMQFVDELKARLSQGKRLHKGVTLDLETLHGTWPVSGPGDANCCPSEVFDYTVRLDNARLILVNAVLRPAGEPPET